MNAPMKAPVVKSPEIFLLAKHSFIDAAGAGPPPRAGPAEAVAGMVNNERTRARARNPIRS